MYSEKDVEYITDCRGCFLYYEVYIDQLFLEILIILVILQKIGGKLMNRSLSAARCAQQFFSGSRETGRQLPCFFVCVRSSWQW